MACSALKERKDWQISMTIINDDLPAARRHRFDALSFASEKRHE
jgi:hypothetical protein